jgi:RNA polymerase sigma factor (sigma-70 family)
VSRSSSSEDEPTADQVRKDEPTADQVRKDEPTADQVRKDEPTADQAVVASARTRLTPAEVTDELERQLGISIKDAQAVAWDLAIRLARDSDDASDLCQEAFKCLTCKVVDRTLHIRGNGVAYLRSTVRNAFRDELANRRAAKRTLPPGSTAVNLSVLEPLVEAHEPRPEDVIEQNDLNAAITQAINSLRDDKLTRRIVMLVVIGGKSKNKIADLLGIPPSTVQSRIASARKDIRAALRRSGWEAK